MQSSQNVKKRSAWEFILASLLDNSLNVHVYIINTNKTDEVQASTQDLYTKPELSLNQNGIWVTIQESPRWFFFLPLPHKYMRNMNLIVQENISPKLAS